MQTTQRNTQQDVVQYVSNLSLELPKRPFPTDKKPVQEELIKEGQEQAFLSDKSIMSFVSNVSEQTREDVLNSTLLAQLAANKQAPIEKDMKAWYDKYVDVLRNVGWVVQNVEVNKYDSEHNLFEIENVIIDILSASFGANYIALIKKTLDSLKQMSQSNDGRIKVFEKNTQSTTKGCFQIGLVTEEGGAVAMQLGTFLLTAKNKITTVLFVPFRKDETKLDYASGQVSLNTKLYSEAARAAIFDRLKKDTVDYIVAIDI